MKNAFLLLCLMGFSNICFAAGGLNFYGSIAKKVFPVDEHHPYQWGAVVGLFLVTVFVALVGFFFKKRTELSITNDITPPKNSSFLGFIEMAVDFAINLAEESIGKGFRSFLPLMTTLFLVILFCNLSGMIPGLPPATSSMSTNVGMALVVFIVYNWSGLKEHGVAGYAKQFMGPALFLAPLMIVIEIISHCSRPFSLSLRLYANLFADHLVVEKFTDLTYLLVPSLMMMFGVLVACIQSYIFVLLTGVYISMARSHDH